MKRVCFYTFGCRLNQSETALIANSFRSLGYEVAEEGGDADVYVVNSCAVTGLAEAKCRHLLRRLRREKPDAYIAVVGCYSQIDPGSLAEIGGVDLIVGTQEKLRLAEFIGAELRKSACPRIVTREIERTAFLMDTQGEKRLSTRAGLKIHDGCDAMCSYCVVPFARGPARSRDFEDIRREALELIAAGHHEIVLTGINIGAYEAPGRTLADVLRMLLDLPGLGRLRISSLEPTPALARVIEIMARDRRLCPHLHISLQSGCDRILRRMNRRYMSAEFLEIVESASSAVPDILLATDIIVGFPGEDEAAFRETCDFFRKSPLAYAHVFSYSPRSGTAAERFEGQVDPAEKKRRSRELQEISRRKKEAFYSRFAGRTLRVLIEEKDAQGRWLGFSENYIRTAVQGENLASGKIAEARIEGVARGLALGTACSGRI